MSTKKINYANDDVKNKFEYRMQLDKELENELIQNSALDENIVLNDFIYDKNRYVVYFDSKYKDAIQVFSNDSKKITYILKRKEGNVVIYGKYHRQIIFEQKNGIYYLRYVDMGTSDINYLINIYEDGKDVDYQKIVNELFYLNRSITNIKDIYYAITEVLDISNIYFGIHSEDNKNVLSFEKGKCTKYCEQREYGMYTEKDYLFNGKFYREKISKEELYGEDIPFIKKIGVRNERRKENQF